jgi:hypothetical protein
MYTERGVRLMFPYLMRSIAKLPNSIKHQSRLTCYFLHISDHLKCSSRLEIDRLGCGSAPNVLPIDAYLRMNRGAHGVANLGYCTGNTNALTWRTIGAWDLLQMLLFNEVSFDTMTLPAFGRRRQMIETTFIHALRGSIETRC